MSFLHWAFAHKALFLSSLGFALSEALPFVSNKYKGLFQGLLTLLKDLGAPTPPPAA